MHCNGYAKLLGDILSSPDGCIVLLNGPWGIGKTYFWEKYSDEHLGNKKNAYVSLFGKTNIEEIQSEALVQIFSRNKIIEKCSKIAQFVNTVLKFGDKDKGDVSFGITGSSIGILLSLVKAKELKDVIVCFDDFERKSHCLKIEEIMGYSSVLSERYGCKVILIMDESKIDSEEKEIYEKYKEKVVDFEIKFNPDQTDIIKTIIATVDDKYTTGVVEAVKFSSLVNLRIIKKIVYQLNLLDKQLTSKFYGGAYTELGFDFTLLAYVYYKLGTDGLHLISGPHPFDDENPKDESDEVKSIRNQLQHKVSSYSDLDILLWDFFGNMRVSAEKIKSILDHNEYSKENNMVQDKVYSIVSDYTFDVSFSDERYVECIFSILGEHKNKLLSIFRLDKLLYILDSLSEVSQDEKFEKFKEDVLQDFVLKKLEKIQSLNDLKEFKNNTTISAITSKYNTLKACVENKIADIDNKLKHGGNITEILIKIPESRSWSPEDVETLNSLSLEFISTTITKDQNFFESTCDFVLWCNRHSGERPFDEFCNNVMNSIVKLGEKGLGAFRFERIKQILNYN